MTNTLYVFDQTASAVSGLLQNLESATQIEFRMPEGGAKFGPSIINSLEARTQIQFTARTESASVAVIDSLSQLNAVNTDRQPAYC